MAWCFALLHPFKYMRTPDLFRFARNAATGNPLRSSLLVLAMAIGVAAVVVLKRMLICSGSRR